MAVLTLASLAAGAIAVSGHAPGTHQYLPERYGLSERGASVLMGQALEYEVANIVDPNFTVVAKMRKSLLAGFTRVPR